MMQSATTPTNFKALVAANRSAGRLADPVPPDASRNKKMAGMRLTTSEMEQAKQLAAGEFRSASSFMRWMYMSGLQSYLAEKSNATAAQ